MFANVSADMNVTLPQHHTLNELYASLTEDLVAELRKLEQTRTCHAGSKLMNCGELPHDLMILAAGQAEILLPCPRHTISLGMVAPGKVLGLKALMTGEGAETDIVCLTPCTVTLLSGTRFLEQLRSHPEIYYVVAKILSADLQQADKVLKQASRRVHRMQRGRLADEAKIIQ
jgi:CRP-like cAMP-binding protein